VCLANLLSSILPSSSTCFWPMSGAVVAVAGVKRPVDPFEEGMEVVRQHLTDALCVDVVDRRNQPALIEYGSEYISEMYYSARLFPGFFASFDLQHVSNPAYNRDRGPVWIPSIRLHMELGKNTLVKPDKH
jgi:hypothetical protein